MRDHIDEHERDGHPVDGSQIEPTPLHPDETIVTDSCDEAVSDRLVRLAAVHLESDPSCPSAWDERLLQWQAAEVRRQSDTDDRDGSHRDRVTALARRIEAAAWIARLSVMCRKGRPPLGREGLAPNIDLGVAAGTGRDLWDEPCDSWIDLPEEMPSGRYLGLSVSGDSMEPLMHTGDTILVRVGTEVQPNTVIVARHPDDGYVVKRVARLTSTAIHLASLNPGYPAVSIPRDPSLIVGTVVMRWCAHEEAARSAG